MMPFVFNYAVPREQKASKQSLPEVRRNVPMSPEPGGQVFKNNIYLSKEDIYYT